MNRDALHSSKSDEWATPDWLFAALDREFSFDLDPCCTAENTKVPNNHVTIEQNGLARDWHAASMSAVWMNPPYSKIRDWMAKAHAESLNGATVVCLVPARTDTGWWHRHVLQASEVRFLQGRLRFGDATANAPFPSAIVVFRPPMVWTNDKNVTFFCDGRSPAISWISREGR